MPHACVHVAVVACLAHSCASVYRSESHCEGEVRGHRLMNIGIFSGPELILNLPPLPAAHARTRVRTHTHTHFADSSKKVSWFEGEYMLFPSLPPTDRRCVLTTAVYH